MAALSVLRTRAEGVVARAVFARFGVRYREGTKMSPHVTWRYPGRVKIPRSALDSTLSWAGQQDVPHH